jgi:AcrR family transcriptional regulator
MVTKGTARSAETASNGLTPSRNGFGRERVVEIQRARILAAMTEVACERGSANVTVAHVVERAGVSRRTFYELFDDREECFLAAFEEAIARVSRLVLDAYDPDAKWDARIRASLVALLLFLDTEPGAGQLLVVGSLGAGARALELRKRVLAQLIAIVDEGRSQRKTREELPPLTAEGVVGGVLAVLHARLQEGSVVNAPPTGDGGDGSLLDLAGPLMSMIVHPYLGASAAQRELKRPVPAHNGRHTPAPADPLRDVHMRLTYRTVRVLMAVAELGARGAYLSNREVGIASGVPDQGQISKLLTRLSKLGLVENSPAGLARGAPNAWMLTSKGAEVERAIGHGTG